MIKDIAFFFVYLAILFFAAKFFGSYIYKVFQQERTCLDGFLNPLAGFIYRITGIDAKKEMNWKEYAVALIWFHVFSFLAVFVTELLQGSLPFNF